jgi:hypothetical protein
MRGRNNKKLILYIPLTYVVAIQLSIHWKAIIIRKKGLRAEKVQVNWIDAFHPLFPQSSNFPLETEIRYKLKRAVVLYSIQIIDTLSGFQFILPWI